MKLLAFLLAFVTQQGQQPTPPQPEADSATYQNLLLGLKFNYPKVWELTPNKKGEARILIPIENTSDRAVVEVFPVNFRSEPNIWQLTQVGSNKAMKRKVERQWEEEILGVPLLLTKVNYSDKGSQKTSETGLIYSFGFNKMMYRVTASPEEFDKADYAWRNVLQSLRMLDDSLPKIEDPSVKIERKDPKATPPLKPGDDIPHPNIIHPLHAPAKVKLVKAPVAGKLTIGTANLEIHLPADWKLQSDKDGVYTLTNAGLSGPATLKVYSVAAFVPPAIAIATASGESLKDFTKVTSREEQLPKANRAGAAISAIWRAGTGAKGQIFSAEATAQTGDFYLLLTFRSTNESRWSSDRRLIESLLEQASVEPAP
jgi:hypothetical protein